MLTSPLARSDDREEVSPSLRGVFRGLYLLFLLISLWATVTNAVPVSVTFVVLTPLFVIALPRNRTMPAVSFAALSMLLYFMLNTAVYAPESFAEADFYRRDGNVFVTLLPVVIGGLVAVRINLESVLRTFVIWASLVNIVFMGVYLATGATIIYSEQGIYHFLFEAHNAAGGYLSMIAAFAWALCFNLKSAPKRLFWRIILISNLAGLWFTGSRGSVIGLVCAVVFVLAMKERFLKTTMLALAMTMFITMYYVYPGWVADGRPLDPTDTIAAGSIGEKDANILLRVLYLWPRAVDLFFESPIFGTGFGSYNDTPYQLSGIRHFFVFNHSSELAFNSAHAHNTYLHVIAETGLVGLYLLLHMLVKMWDNINAMRPMPVQLAMRLAFWVAVFSSMTEHRLFTPAQMLPFTILFAMSLSSARWTKLGLPAA